MENFIQTISQELSSKDFSITFLFISFLGGLLASLTPCTLAILPIIMGYIGGYSDKSISKTVIQLLSFTLSLSLVLTIIGTLASILGKAFISFGGAYFILLMASIILILGLNLLGVLEFNLPPLFKKMPKGNASSLFLYPAILGGVFAISATPCSTPVLAGIMGYASLANNIALGALMLFFFALGQSVIIVIAGIFTQFTKKALGFSNILEGFLKFMGAILVLSALYLYYKTFLPLII